MGKNCTIKTWDQTPVAGCPNFSQKEEACRSYAQSISVQVMDLVPGEEQDHRLSLTDSYRNTY